MRTMDIAFQAFMSPAQVPVNPHVMTAAGGTMTGDISLAAISATCSAMRKAMMDCIGQNPTSAVLAFDDSPNNNIVWDLHGASVFIDNQAQEPEKRYKAIGFSVDTEMSS